ncbi:hypothetical protein M9194_05895 [Vibrio sp. S4M6]|uniref:DUF6572 domain-containing protein n=1 Tax=Vibrio sinus TaxID=2946865 RepID=UPI00202A79FB|nr:DUF6572 domain-containing protein [Vibrio sinus]MCL9780963.1 hypothetical protein [Vibrio sinus]
MSVTQTNVVDIISVLDEDNQVILTISDHLEWGSSEHLLALQDKLNNYVSFIESGELLRSYNDAKERNVVISLVCQYEPDQAAINFLSRVDEFISGLGLKFQYKVQAIHTQ